MSPGGWVAALPRRARRKARHLRGLAIKALTERRGPAAYRLSPNTWKQDLRASLADVLAELGPEPARPAGPLRIAHIVNPFTAAKGSGHERAQAATFASMRRAKGLAGDGLVVDLVAVRQADDVVAGLDGFVMAPPLTRTVLDVASFSKPRPLPILSDILELGVETSPTADLIVYTNVDINVAPHFYEALKALAARGITSTTICKRLVASSYQADGGTEWSLAAVDRGLPHGGYDCFVFPRRDFASFVPSRACVGMPAVARPILFNMVAQAERMVILTNVQMTYHFGDDRDWSNPDFRDYYRFNVAESHAVIHAYRSNPACFARLDPFLEAHNEFGKLSRIDTGDLGPGQKPG